MNSPRLKSVRAYELVSSFKRSACTVARLDEIMMGGNYDIIMSAGQSSKNLYFQSFFRVIRKDGLL